MLLVAIPKSASTSLLYTLLKYYHLDGEQSAEFKQNQSPENCQALHNYHSDVRELVASDVTQFESQKHLFKQHIYPSAGNLTALKGLKKVVLLRNPDDIIQAYKRGVQSNVHKEMKGFEGINSDEEWSERAKQIGLVNDLKFFYSEWSNTQDPNTLIVHYEDLMTNPTEEFKKIESFWGLNPCSEQITLVKARYSGGEDDPWIKPTLWGRIKAFFS